MQNVGLLVFMACLTRNILFSRPHIMRGTQETIRLPPSFLSIIHVALIGPEVVICVRVMYRTRDKLHRTD
jgi:hypothetical protein